MIPGGYSILPTSTPISNESVTTRAAATPITYKLQITTNGILSLGYYYNGGTYNTVIPGTNIASSNGTMPATFKFGFGASTGGGTNVHEITCFQASPIGSNTSAGVNSVQAGQIRTSTQAYIATYHPNNWWGELTASNLMISGNTITTATIANWDASCVLTGGVCVNPPNPSVTAESPSTRQILTWNGAAGTGFEWGNLTTTEQSTFNSEATTIGSPATGQYILNWLRGDTSEAQPAGPLRQRSAALAEGVLGDIVDSSPTVVSGPALGYAALWSDAFYGASTTQNPENAASATTYPAFSGFSTGGFGGRLNVAYVGANDGMLHGFETGNYNSAGTYNSSTNDGKEVLAYVPGSLITNTAALASPAFIHQYFVDATPGTGDVFYDNTWHTWLAGGFGTGGSGIYALDVTDPTQFTESNAAALVKGEWTPSNISCINVAGCASNLGALWGTPILRRLHNGQWAMIFGNGYNSSSDDAGIFIGLINPASTTGTVTFYYLDTGVGSSSNPNGIDYVTSADLDSDHITDYLYAGDLQGNVWRFNLTSSKPADWAVSKYGQSSATPLYTAPQPVTTQIAVAESYLNGQNYIIAMFGTGQQTPATQSAPTIYASGSHKVYGIWDWDMNNWNNGYTTAHSVVVPASTNQLAFLPTPQATLGLTNLAQQIITTSGTTRTISNNSVCWQGGSTCTTNNQYGWYANLPASNEQIIYNPTIYNGALIVNTTIPPGSSVVQCNASIATGFTMAFNVTTGGSLPVGLFNGVAGASGINGEQFNGTGTPFILTSNGSAYLVTQTSGAVGGANGGAAIGGAGIYTQPQYSSHQVNWELLR
jgi:type IV pilus assembly protein PilY1